MQYPIRLLALVILAALAVPAEGRAAQAPACSERPVFGWLDFWVGEWRVLVDNRQVGTNSVKKVLDGCAVTEDWTDARGGTGRSLFYVSPETGLWRQVWVTNSALAPGGVKEKHLIARHPDRGVRFQGQLITGGSVVLDRTTLTPLPDRTVRQTIEHSHDGGATWTTAFDAIYVPAEAK